MAYLTAGVGVVVLVAVVLLVLARLRRFSRAAERLRAELQRGADALPAVTVRHR
ncbi:MAG: hypothetical protein L0H64_22780 [Pseudonocardia sp.]|nr:hypothetical protein [Pseudonocardia sp.]